MSSFRYASATPLTLDCSLSFQSVDSLTYAMESPTWTPTPNTPPRHRPSPALRGVLIHPHLPPADSVAPPQLSSRIHAFPPPYVPDYLAQLYCGCTFYQFKNVTILSLNFPALPIPLEVLSTLRQRLPFPCTHSQHAPIYFYLLNPQLCSQLETLTPQCYHHSSLCTSLTVHSGAVLATMLPEPDMYPGER